MQQHAHLPDWSRPPRLPSCCCSAARVLATAEPAPGLTWLDSSSICLLLRLLFRGQARPHVLCGQSDLCLHSPPDLVLLLVLVCNHLLLQPAATSGTLESHRAQYNTRSRGVVTTCCFRLKSSRTLTADTAFCGSAAECSRSQIARGYILLQGSAHSRDAPSALPPTMSLLILYAHAW